jgi:Tfp pilus assembly protein PilN
VKTTRLHLEFAPNARRVTWLGVAMLIAGIAVLGVSAVQLTKVLTTQTHQANTLAALEARQGAALAAAAARAKRPTPTDPAELARTRAVRLVAQNLVTPWADLLASLESAPNKSVALLSVEPSVSRHSLRLTAEARSAQDMLGYLSALQRDSRLSSVVLVSHQVQAQAPGTPVRFQVQAAWGGGL